MRSLQKVGKRVDLDSSHPYSYIRANDAPLLTGKKVSFVNRTSEEYTAFLEEVLEQVDGTIVTDAEGIIIYLSTGLMHLLPYEGSNERKTS